MIDHTTNTLKTQGKDKSVVRLVKREGRAGQSKAPREKVTLTLLSSNVEYLRSQGSPMNALVDDLITKVRGGHSPEVSTTPASTDQPQEVESKTFTWRDPAQWTIHPPEVPIIVKGSHGFLKWFASLFLVLLLLGCTTTPSGHTGVRLPTCSFSVGGKHPGPTRCTMRGGTVVIPIGGF